MTRGEELSQIRRGLAGMKSDINRFVETVQQSIAQAEERLDAMAAEAAKPGPLESTEVRPDFFSKNEPHTFEERVGDAPYADTPWRISEDGDRIVECARGGDTGTFTTKEDARWVVNIANNWDRIVAVIEAARGLSGSPIEAIGRVTMALRALDAAEVLR